MKKYILVLAINFIAFTQARCQNSALFGQYVFNSTIINPAQAGVFEDNQIGLLHRKQWIGFEGAPVTSSVFTNFKLDNHLGMALGIYEDRIGPINETTLQVDFSYSLRISKKWALAAGIRVSGTNSVANLDELKNIDKNDPNLNGTEVSGYLGNLGLGILAYTSNAFIGIALPQAMSRTLEIGVPIHNILTNNLYVYSGFTHPLNDECEIVSSFMLKKGLGNPPQIDIHAIFKFRNKFDVGPMFRLSNAIGVLTGWRISENWYLGYQFEFPMSAIQNGSSQTHEIALRYHWDSSFRSIIKSPRYFM
jgi:type IX secretion system PorP/SprF family membrane protein